MEFDDTQGETVGEEHGLLAKLVALGEAHDQQFELDHRMAIVAAGLFDEPLNPVKIGRFTIVRKLGSGGMGVVYVAYDETLDRKVAVKLLRSASPTPEARARLEREAQAMARLTHPNVVAVHEVGSHVEQVFVAMEFVEGSDLRGWLAAEPRDWRAIAAVYCQAGEGLSAAHEAGIVHRDFKPDNALVGKDGRVRVADFGLAHGFEGPSAKLPVGGLEDSQGRLSLSLTRTGALMGTPAYMAPEQYAGKRTDARGDQFSFCVALWEALYRQRPFSGESLVALSTAVCDGEIDEPPVDSEVPPWLQTILRRGLASDPDARWPSMRELLDALGHDPVAARRRALLGFGLGGATLALLASLTWLAVTELRANARQRELTEQTEALLELERERGLQQARNDALRARDATRMSVARDFKPKVNVAEREDPTIAAVVLREVEGELRRSGEWMSMANELLGQPLCHEVLSGHRDVVGPLSFSPDGAWLYTGSDDGVVRRWKLDVGVGEPIITHDKPIRDVVLSPDGRLLASSSSDGTVRSWSVASGQSELVSRHERPIKSLAFDDQGQLLASGTSDGDVEVVTLDTGDVTRLRGDGGEVFVLQFDHSCQRLLSGSADAKVRVYRLRERQAELEAEMILEGHRKPIYHARFIDERRAVTASDDGTARLWWLDDESRPSVVVAHHAKAITSIDVFESQLATVAVDGSIRVSSLAPPYASLELPSHADAVWSVSFTPDGQFVATTSFDKTARLTRADGRGVPQVFLGHQQALCRGAIDPTGRWLATGSYDADVRLWDLQRPRLATPLVGHVGSVSSLALDRDGARVITASHDGSARIWSTHDGSSLALLDGAGAINHAEFSPDGRLVAFSRVNGHIDLWEGSERRSLSGHERSVWRIRFDASGRRLVSASYDGTAKIWDVESGSQLQILRGHEAEVSDAAFTLDGARVVTAAGDGTLRVWDANTGVELDTLRGHQGDVSTLVPGPDGEVWATGSSDGTARLWTGDLGGDSILLAGHTQEIWSVAFDAEGSRVVTASNDGDARVWDTSDGSLLEVLDGHANVVWDAAFISADRVVTASGDGSLRVWSLGSSSPPLVLSGHGSMVLRVVASRDGAQLVSGGDDGSVIRWSLDGVSADPEVLLARLRGATRVCLSAEQRSRELGEDRLAASVAAAACERDRKQSAQK
ncbi:serine/threonine-protein kinase [Enhygromyxa salina]|uniref:Serine/threonine-protein kinase StkP n=1 Tax=Enhygromyxa salina TaxID=215803 RepID=A0A2S9XQP6_9BACT|nr:serine/threonine-protein kinase [Enhygromyxa salina]PRP95188.1 Serine/threonine-protein kinase StkP [Enhygromyxa salina]